MAETGGRPKLDVVSGKSAFADAMQTLSDSPHSPEHEYSPSQVAESDWYQSMFLPELTEIKESTQKRKELEDETKTVEINTSVYDDEVGRMETQRQVRKVDEKAQYEAARQIQSQIRRWAARRIYLLTREMLSSDYDGEEPEDFEDSDEICELESSKEQESEGGTTEPVIEQTPREVPVSSVPSNTTRQDRKCVVESYSEDTKGEEGVEWGTTAPSGEATALSPPREMVQETSAVDTSMTIVDLDSGVVVDLDAMNAEIEAMNQRMDLKRRGSAHDVELTVVSAHPTVSELERRGESSARDQLESSADLSDSEKDRLAEVIRQAQQAAEQMKGTGRGAVFTFAGSGKPDDAKSKETVHKLKPSASESSSMLDDVLGKVKGVGDHVKGAWKEQRQGVQGAAQLTPEQQHSAQRLQELKWVLDSVGLVHFVDRLDQKKVAPSTLPQLNETWLEKMEFEVGEQLEFLEAVKGLDADNIEGIIARKRQGVRSHDGEKGTTIAGRFLSATAERVVSAHSNWIFGEEKSSKKAVDV
jgi:hypothetical protein